MPFLIDGHNVIAVLDDIDLEDPHDEAKLVMRLRSWSARTSRKAIVVFDGGLPGGPAPALSTVDVKVIFAARHHTNADRVIHERVSALPDPGNWTVVSSDREVLDQAHASGARTLTAQEFVDVLERPATPEKEKPDTVNAAEVAEWLEIFIEPEKDTAPTQSQPGQPTVTTAKVGSQPHRSRQRPPDEKSNRHNRTIGEQLGVEVAPLPKLPRPSSKPTDASEAEIEDWLQVFHDDPDSQIPPPKLPKKLAPKQARPAEPVVRKDGALSESEVETWLSLFEARADSEAESDSPTSLDTPKKRGAATNPSGRGTPERQPAQRNARPNPRKVSPKLAKHQQNLTDEAREHDKTGLSQEDIELWHRLYGDEG